MYSLNTRLYQKQIFDDSLVLNAWEDANRALQDSNSDLVFDSEQHRYHLSNGRELPSVSDIVKYYAPFDTLACAQGCAKNPKHPLYGKSVEEILQIWEKNRDESAEAGTAVHEFAEACYLAKRGRVGEIDPKYAGRLSENGLEASCPKEEAAALWWDSLDLNRYALIAKETRIVNPVLNYAGTFDLLLYDRQRGFYVLRDYKTNKELFKAYGKLLPPLSVIPSSDHGKYTLQQNMYKIQLENIGIRVGEMKLIWLKEDATFEEVEIPDYGKLITYALTEKFKN